jgi:hypothetical protein
MWQSDLHWAVEIATQILVVNERLLPQVGSLLFYSENWGNWKLTALLAIRCNPSPTRYF